MKKVLIVISSFLIVLASCKKDGNTPADKIDAVGVWTFFSYSSQQNNNAAVTYTSTEHPCLSKNKMFLNSDGTLKGGYTGTDTCVVARTATSSFAIGQKGDSATGTWTQSGNTVTFLVLGRTSTGMLQTINGTPQLIEMDTLSYNNTVITTIFKK